MMLSLYSVSYLAAIFCSILWSFFDARGRNFWAWFPKIGFFLSTSFYLFNVFYNAEYAQESIVFIMLRDLGLLHVLTWLTTKIAIKKSWFGLWFMILLGGMMWLYAPNVLEKSFSKHKLGYEPNQEIEQVQLEVELDKEGELLFDIKKENQLESIKEKLTNYNVTIKRAFPEIAHPERTNLDEYYVVNIGDAYENKVVEIFQSLSAMHSAVDWVEYNEIVSINPMESSKLPSNQIQYVIDDERINELWGFEHMKMNDTYKFLKKAKIKPPKVAKIAILDTGVDGSHPDLKDNYVSTSKEYDADKRGHGTHCAGIAGAVSNNKIGVASYAPNNDFVQITSIKVLSDYGFGSQQGIINGMIKAADKGADVLSMSLGGPSNDSAQKAYNDAVEYANKANAIVVVAAGNSNANSTKFTPANCEGVITVSAVDNDLNRAKFSNYINDLKMGIAAPGVDILSTYPDGDYQVFSGTSMATPYVAGLLGMMKAINPKITTAEAYKILRDTGIETTDTHKTGKFIQPLKVLEQVID